MRVPCKNIPTYDAFKDEWSVTSFENQFEMGAFLREHCFKEPGLYNFPKPEDYDFPVLINKIGELGKLWEKKKYYTLLPTHSEEWEKFWKFEQLKSRLGVLWKHGENWWYITRDYYFFLNYCPITNKEQDQEETMATFRDGQYHMMLYEKLAEIYHSHSAVLKRRQFLYSYCHVAKALNYVIFENKKTIKWFASDDSFIDDTNGSWKILNAYKNHLQTYTAWDKVFTPDSYPSIQQKEKINVNGKWLTEGTDSTIVAKTLKRDAKLGVGGPCLWAWYEEGGIAPTADKTLGYMESAFKSGTERVGSFCIGGSVGDLKECAPLEQMITFPNRKGIFAVPTRYFDDTGTIKMCGLFIPAQWGMPQATDSGGNSDVAKAFELLHKAEFIGFKAGEDGRIQDEDPWCQLTEEEYNLAKSQNPKTIEEAFAFRDVLYFPTQKIDKRQKQYKILIENKQLQKPKHGVLSINSKNQIEFTPIDRKPNSPVPMEYPVDSNQKDKRGVVTIYKDPPKNPKYLRFFGGIDTIEKIGQTSTSDSLMAVYIMERLTEVSYFEHGVRKIKYTGGGIVATYVGRYADIEDTNEQAELLIRLYNAFCACERNKPGFITHMRTVGLAEKHMMRRKDLPLFKDADQTGLNNNDFGVYIGSDGVAQGILNMNIKEYLLKPLDTINKKDSEGQSTQEVVKVIRGLDTIEDYWLLEELKKWYDGLNTDRRVAFGLAIIALNCYTITYGYNKEIEKPRKQQPVSPPIPRSLLPGYAVRKPFSNNSGSKPMKRRSLLPY